MNIVLIYFSIKYKGYFHDIYNAIKNKEFIPIEELNKIKDEFENGKIKAITIVDDDYPEPLKLINNPPFVLFYKGNRNLINRKIFSLTGDFENDNINKFLNEATNEISKNSLVISNGTSDLDLKIINLFNENKKEFIIISPNGISNPYFNKNVDISQYDENKFLLISEYPENVNINKRRLVERNRITMGLSELLIIASSHKNSRIQSLVSYALEQGKDVYCYPGLQDEEDGNNLLIQDGAIMITSIKNKIKNI